MADSILVSGEGSRNIHDLLDWETEDTIDDIIDDVIGFYRPVLYE